MKKTLAMVLTVLMMLSLAACGDSFGSAMVKAASEMEKVESVHTDMTMGFTMNMPSLEQSAEMTMSTSIDSTNEPMMVRGESTTTLMGMSIPVEYYIEQIGDKYNMYISSDSGEKWQAQLGISADEVAQYDFIDSVEFYLECASAFEKTGEEEINGSIAVRYDGIVTGENMRKMLEVSGSMDQMNELVGEGGELPELGEMPMSIWLDKKSGLPVRYDMDMTGVMQSMMDQMSESAGTEIVMDSVFISAVMSNYNAVAEIVIPENAKSA